MSQAMYQVTAECVYATMSSPYGMTRQLLYKGALIPGDTKEIEHLVEHGLVTKVGGEDETGINAVGTLGAAETDEGAAGSVVTSGPILPEFPTVGAPDERVEAAREAARAKLAELGGTPDGRSSDAVLVEYLAGKGYDRTELEKSDRAELRKLVADAK